MKNILVVCFAVCLAFSSILTMRTCADLISVQPLPKEQQLDQINELIRVLKDQKLGYEGKALYSENKAQRLQFVDGEQATAKKLWQLAEGNRKMAADIDVKIRELEKQRADLLKSIKADQ